MNRNHVGPAMGLALVLAAFSPAVGAVAIAEQSRMFNVGFRELPPGLGPGDLFLGAEILSVNDRIAFMSVLASEPTAFEAAAALDPNVRYVSPDAPDAVGVLAMPNDPHAPSQYGWGRIDAIDAWDTTTGSTSVSVAVLDSGVERGHPDFEPARVLPGMTCAGGDPLSDDHGHGTHVAGTIAATSNNGVGVAGATKSSIRPAKVVNAEGTGSFACLANAITWAADQGAHVLSISLACTVSGCFDPATSDAIAYARNARGAIVVISAGNGYGGPVSYPGSDPNAFTVSCTTSTDDLCSFSSVGPEVDLAAPGSAILSTCLGGRYCSMSGTSMSAPHVSGVAALVKAENPSWQAAEIEARLRETARDLGATGFDSGFGHGLVQARAAVGGAPPPPPPPPPPAVHVSAMSASFAHAKSKHTLTCAATVVDDAGKGVKGATVSFSWQRPTGASATSSATTSSAGVATATLSGQNAHGTYVCAVTGVSATLPHDPRRDAVSAVALGVT